MMRIHKNTRGFTLIEILITVLILSIGLLGLAGLQVTSMRNNHSSYLRTQATIKAYDIIDRMRANPQGVTDGKYVVTGSIPSAVTCDKENPCNSSSIAQQDINEWRTELANVLPGGDGVVCLDDVPLTPLRGDDGSDISSHACSNNGSVYVVKIWWTDDRSGNFQRFVTSYAP